MGTELKPERMLVSALEGIEQLGQRIWPLLARKNAPPPFAVYRKTGESRTITLDGPTEMLHCGFDIFLVACSYEELADLGEMVTAALDTLQGRSLSTEDGGNTLLIEYVKVVQNQADDFDDETALYLRTYAVDIDYQYEGSEG